MKNVLIMDGYKSRERPKKERTGCVEDDMTRKEMTIEMIFDDIWKNKKTWFKYK